MGMTAADESCARASDASLYVLGEMRPRQQQSYARHLRHCEVCAEEVDLLQHAAQAVPLLAVSHVPPPLLEPPPSQIPKAVAPGASRADSRPQASAVRPVPVEARSPSGRPELRTIQGGGSDRPDSPRISGRRRLLQSPVPKPALLGLLLLAIFAVMTVALSHQAASTRYRRIQAGWPNGGAAIKLQGTSLQLLVLNMPKPQHGTRYQVWVGDRLTHRLLPTTVWLHLNARGEAGVTIPGDYHDWYVVAVYVEPRRGSDTISSGAVVVGDLRHLR